MDTLRYTPTGYLTFPRESHSSFIAWEGFTLRRVEPLFVLEIERMAKLRGGRKLVQFEATEELIARIDARASRELLNRSSWLRRLADAATKGLPA